MKMATFHFKKYAGWTVRNFPDMDSENTLILIFASPEFIDRPGPIKELAKHYPQSKIIGCSSAGEISGSHILDNSITVAIVKFEKTQIEIIKTEINSKADSYAGGEFIIKKLYNNNLRGVFVLSDGLNVNGSEFVRGLNALNNDKIIITGGLAGDGTRFQETWALYNGEIFKKNAIAVGFYGDHIQIGYSSRGGWDKYGPEQVVTRSEGNVLYELDGVPALDIYREYLGDRADGLPANGILYPLAIRKDVENSQQLIRAMVAVDEKTRSLTFGGDVPQGYRAQLMRANFDHLIVAADEAGVMALKSMPGMEGKEAIPMLAIAVSCVGRRLLLGERTEEETESTLSALPKNTVQVGFYSYGELSPHTSRDCDLHNQTITLTTLFETL